MILYPFLPQTITLGSFNFYTYGLLIGLAIVIGFWLVEHQAKKANINLNQLWELLLAVFVGGLIGARLWHVATDWKLYQAHWLEVFNLRHGGLSILGVIAGSSVALYCFSLWQKKHHPNKFNWRLALDLSVFGLPMAQAVGRLGNFANQELYGLPVVVNSTNKLSQYLPKLYISPEFRLPTYEPFSFYQPLFLYEIVGLLFIVGLVYWVDSKQSFFFKLGTGRLFLFYLTGYSWLRFFLEFIRLQKSIFSVAGVVMGINQVVLLWVGVVGLTWLIKLRS